ncbi:MAG: GTP-binding protein [Lachnospiraceae bacterium]|nr:GTP-binding protein [Candidatus Colinaster scatohippi]
MIKIDVVSGFLGAGKTTLIKKLLSEVFKGERVVLIENEFGEIGVDGGFLKDAGIEITEMNSGCICCSLVGDFGTALHEVIEKYTPDRILIEPSGVGKLSDVMKAISEAKLGAEVTLNSAVAVVDASKAKMYIKNFGEFFINQIEHAGTIILSRTGNITEDKLNKAISLIREHNEKATIITTPWEQLEGQSILDTIEGAKSLEEELMAQVMEEHHHDHDHHHEHGDDCTCGCHDHDHEHHDHDHHEHDHEHHDHEHHDHEHHDHDHHHEHGEECTCGCHDHDHHHHHHADDVFTSWGHEGARKYTKAEVENILEELDDCSKYGLIIRSKGMVQDSESDGWIYFDYTPGESNVREGRPDVTGKICVIGSELKTDELEKLFG